MTKDFPIRFEKCTNHLVTHGLTRQRADVKGLTRFFVEDGLGTMPSRIDCNVPAQ